MDHSTRRNMLFMAMFAIGVVLAQGQVAAPQGVNEFCKTAIEKEMCTKQVKGATTWHDAVKNALESTAELNTEFQKMLPEVIQSIKGPSKASVVKTCSSDFKDLAINIKESIGFLAKNDTGSISSYLSSCNISMCQESLEGAGSALPPHVAKAFDELHWYIDNCLAVTNQN